MLWLPGITTMMSKELEWSPESLTPTSRSSHCPVLFWKVQTVPSVFKIFVPNKAQHLWGSVEASWVGAEGRQCIQSFLVGVYVSLHCPGAHLASLVFSSPKPMSWTLKAGYVDPGGFSFESYHCFEEYALIGCLYISLICSTIGTKIQLGPTSLP